MSSAPAIASLGFLVVEDQGFQRWTLAMLLRRIGALRVFSAADGRAALEVMRGLDEPVDIIVTDLDMPEMDGMEFIRHLGEEFDRMSLIVTSGLDRSLVGSVETMAHAYGVTLLGAIEKPVDAETLQSLIARHRPAGAKADPAEVFGTAEIVAGLRAGQFEPYLQPKVFLAEGGIAGAEALARWRHPVHGIVGPQSFIEQLERAGELGALTESLLAKALEVCGPWLRSEFHATIAVNLSLTSLSAMTLADRMVRLVRDAGAETRDVVFEVTESAAASDLGRSLENLLRLRMKGFGLSIDDYGTGYSSMQQLSRVAFTELKIDQSFLRNAARHPASRAMLESGLEMAQKLGITAVCEGVEGREEWDLLKALGCTVAQGFFIARPMDAARFQRWITDWRPDV